MADNIDVTPGVGKTVAADEVSGVLYQRVKITYGADGSVTDVSPTNKLPVIGGAKVISTQSKTRPNDTTQYTAYDIINESVSAGTPWTFADCAAEAGGAGVIKRAFLHCSANQATKLQADLLLYRAAPSSAGNDNAAVAVSDSDKPIAAIAFRAVNTHETNATGSGATGNVVIGSGFMDIPFICDADANLYGILIARNAYTPIGEEVFNIDLIIQQD